MYDVHYLDTVNRIACYVPILNEIISCSTVLPLHTLTPPSHPNLLRYHSDSYWKGAGNSPSYLKRLKSETEHPHEFCVLINSLNCRVNSNFALPNRDTFPMPIIRIVNKIPQTEHK